ncbi:hypothetical protein UY3_03576 [Chelonia mydas]|uniref:Uncharacterized protein n=1 Tax=Chelonia mydas TaxID=8469 RepID=M7BMT3_CHEMY|nr:hypothetical protein UY3_03576 [Chelonia mydas]
MTTPQRASTSKSPQQDLDEPPAGPRPLSISGQKVYSSTSAEGEFHGSGSQIGVHEGTPEGPLPLHDFSFVLLEDFSQARPVTNNNSPA